MAKKEQKGLALSTENWVEKSNPLNEIRNTRMTPTQQRLFLIYLSKINPRKYEETREVAFKLEEYTKIMEHKQMNTTRLIKSAEELLGLTVRYWDKDGTLNPDGYKGIVISQLFKRFRLYKNEEQDEWYVSINCHDDAKKLMFDLKHYFQYQLWNILPLASTNQQRMYELLKQYEKAGERIVSLKDLREWLWIKSEEYPRWQNFKVRVLDSAQEALLRYTDIKFTWDVAERKGRGGSITKIRFVIEKNDDYVRQYTIEEFMDEYGTIEFEGEPEAFERTEAHELEDDGDGGQERKVSLYQERIEFLSDACGNEFGEEEIKVLYDLMMEHEPQIISDTRECFRYLQKLYNYMGMHDKKREIKSRFAYIKSLIGKEI